MLSKSCQLVLRSHPGGWGILCYIQGLEKPWKPHLVQWHGFPPSTQANCPCSYSNILVWKGLRVPGSMLNTSTRITGVVDYEHPLFPSGIAERERNATARENHPTQERWDAAGREKHERLGFVCSPWFVSLPAASRLSRVGWFSCAHAFRSLYYPWGKMRD